MDDASKERTAVTDNPTTPPPAQHTAYGWCSWHEAHASGVRLIQAHEQGSGPGGGAFACRPCRESFGLVPFSERPL